MDFVIVTFQPDIKLLRHCLASYDLYYRDKNRLFIFASEEDRPLLERINMPDNATVQFREDFPELNDIDSASQAAYLKLKSFEVVTTEFFCVIDSDFLFIAPTSDQDFFRDGKPVWFYRPWTDEPPLRHKKAAEGFVKQTVSYNFMDKAQYVFKRSVAADLVARHPPKTIHRQEFVIYGWFAYGRHRDEYRFTRSDEDRTQLIVGLVNQVPPDYRHLDPACSYTEFKDSKIVVFWSFWDLAETKMIEFFEDSQRAHFGRVIRHADRSPLFSIVDPNNITKGRYRYFEGVFTDGWVKEVIRFMLNLPDGSRSIVLELMVPPDPKDPDWRLTGEALIGDQAAGSRFDLGPGLNQLAIELPQAGGSGLTKVELRFDPGFQYPENPDQREFRARLLGLGYERVSLEAGSGHQKANYESATE